MREREPRNQETPEKRLSKRAANIFIGASRQEPNSNIRQGAVIALICQRPGIEHPMLLEQALLKDPEEIDHVYQTALEEHAKRAKKRPQISREQTMGVIQYDFIWASKLFSVPPEEITRVLDYNASGNNDAIREAYAENIITDYFDRKLREESRGDKT